jgi:uncharacterized integral membrane protein
MNEYMYLLAVVIGVMIAILLKWKDIAEILRLRREITKIDKEIHPHA